MTATAKAAAAVIENLLPCIDCGRSAIKRIVGEPLVVEADVFKDGHDEIAVALLWRRRGTGRPREALMRPMGNDRWHGLLVCARNAHYEYTVETWLDVFATWSRDFLKKHEADIPDLETERAEGAMLLRQAAARAPAAAGAELDAYARRMEVGMTSAARAAKDPRLAALMAAFSPRQQIFRHEPWLPLFVDRPAGGIGAWYEFFPRSAAGLADRGSTLRECLPRIEDAKRMGFDVVYFPPIHPIGETKRKGPNNSLKSKPGDPGVPYAIGNRRQGVNGGGHKDVAPELGTLADFEWLVEQTRERGMEIALDFAINCSPDHPYVHEHPEWFFHRPDGTIKYAENPPKKYEDIYPLNFHTETRDALWREMRDIILFWVRRGVRIFRVDNPHTKPVAFWAWLIEEVRARDPGAIFLSEAFTRPRMMAALAKAGFTQSYTYFTWRNTSRELREYLQELAHTQMREFFRPNFFTNTPDILPFYLQHGGRAAFLVRAMLAATLSPVYGIYSAFELCENSPVPGREEYLDSEKYQFKARDWDAPGNIKEWIRRLNAARAGHRALQRLDGVVFHECYNENLLVYSKITPAGDDRVLCAVNLDPHNPQRGEIEMQLERFGLHDGLPYVVEDLLDGACYTWQGRWNYVELAPERPAHLFRIVG